MAGAISGEEEEDERLLGRLRVLLCINFVQHEPNKEGRKEGRKESCDLKGNVEKGKR